VAVSPDGRHPYTTNQTANTVSVTGTASNTVTGTIPVNLGPVGVAVTSDGRQAYVADIRTGSGVGSGTGSVINTGTG
jgi:YVTN family beta-propeller protein